MKTGYMGLAGVALLSGLGLAAHASSEGAWQQQRQQLVSRCTAAAKKQQAGKISVRADPFGSESYALALVQRQGTLKGGKSYREEMICVMDKRSGKVELGGPLGK